MAFLSAFLFFQSAEAATIREYSDRLSNSAPNESSNHTINFKTNATIPANGYIRYTPENGEFNIPGVDFDINNVALYVAPSASATYQLRSATTTPSATEDGVAITTGTSGNIEITLNSSNQIASGSYIRLLIGNHTDNSTTTDTGLFNPSATGTYEYYLSAGDGVTDTEVTGKYAIVEKVEMQDIDTTETIPPFRFNGAPTGELSGTTQQVQLSLETNEFAKCRYSSASGTPYFSMGIEFTNYFTVVHSKIFEVATDTTYSLFVRCIDDEGNENIDDYEITFTIKEYPEGEPGDPGDDEGDGQGGGGGGGSGSGGGGGGSSGGGTSSDGEDEGGGFEDTNQPYQSGDGRVTIKGYAFPKSTVIVLVDGYMAEEVKASSDGSFSIIIDEIARGAYTFGVYAVDDDDTKSSTFSTTFTVTGGRGSTLSNVNIMPSILVEPDPVDPGGTVTFSGYSIPNATVSVENQNDKSSVTLKSFTTTSDSDGKWSIAVSTSGFKEGTYKVRAKAKQDGGVSTEYSNFTFYGVGEAAKVAGSSDLNKDGKVNLIDFSILLFWWNSDGGESDPPADINQDGKVSLTDFSIMIFNWTG